MAFRDNVFPDPDGLIAWINDKRSAARVRPDQKVVLFRDWQKIEDRLRGAKTVLEKLVGIAEHAKAA